MLKKSMEVAKVVGIVGWSGSGKTTLLEFLLSQLALMNKKINEFCYLLEIFPTKEQT